MDLSVNKLNLFNTQAFQGIQATPAVKPKASAEVAGAEQTSGNPFAKAVSNSNMFSGNTAGVNTNIGIGDFSYTAPQAGVKAGISRTIAFA